MKKLVLIAIAAVVMTAFCAKLRVTDENLAGTWYECYDDPYFVMDGSVTYTFDGESNVVIGCYNVHDGSRSEEVVPYALGIDGRNNITLNPHRSDASCVTYRIVSLTKDEMAWQRVGTKFSKGSYGSDYRHFKRASENIR